MWIARPAEPMPEGHECVAISPSAIATSIPAMEAVPGMTWMTLRTLEALTGQTIARGESRQITGIVLAHADAPIREDLLSGSTSQNPLRSPLDPGTKGDGDV